MSRKYALSQSGALGPARWKTSDAPDQSRTISDNLGQSRGISGNLGEDVRRARRRRVEDVASVVLE